ncbi:MAG: LapA family protein [Marinospirillum sp.]|uniref:LapA family protein n=1 Tax=Marinospirillum sp. TaxID=2183934 RepID=UPI0019EABD01|nr:LapA family protein [Marinospirillum sp.]MBE0506210.1 LapA family protein [Marinospirillum sp.]
MQLFKSLLTFLLVLALLVLGIWFTLRNQHPVPLDLLFIQLPENSMALWLILSLICGVLLGCLLMLPWLTRCKTHNLQVERQLKHQKEELHKLRTLTLKIPD